MMALIVIVFMNSARKNRAKRKLEYSVLNPPTSSCSASTRSNGGRLSSAVAAMTNIDERHEAGGDDVPVGERVLGVDDAARRQRPGDEQTAATLSPSAAS